MKGTSKRPVITVGQTVFVSFSSWYGSSTPNLNEYEVTKVNTRSFYAIRKGSDYERRFDLKTLRHEDSFGEIFQAYLSEKTYWNKVKIAEEKKELRSEIEKSLLKLNLNQLREIHSIIKQGEVR